MPVYAAFLRGINLGKRTVKMAELRQVLEQAGYASVKTLLASGNVVFSQAGEDSETLAHQMEASLQAAFGFGVPVIVRSQAALQALVDSDPFGGIAVDKDTRLYISFLAEGSSTDLPAGLRQDESQFSIALQQPGTLASVVRLGAGRGSLDLMDALDKHFGSQVTTRNWNTVLKVQATLSEL